MHRTTILLSDDLRAKAATAARRRGITLSELIRRLLARHVRSSKSADRADDPLFNPRRLMTRPSAGDISARHHGSQQREISRLMRREFRIASVQRVGMF